MYWHFRSLDFTLTLSSAGNCAVSLVFSEVMEAFSEAFDIRRVNLVGDPEKQWFVLNSTIWGCQPSKILSRSPLVQNFPSEFALVKLVDVKDLTVLAMDRRSSRGESVAVASLFGVVCAVTRRTIKSSEVSCYKRLIDAINELKIDLGRAWAVCKFTDRQFRPANRRSSWVFRFHS